MRSVQSLVRMALYGQDHMGWYESAKLDIEKASDILGLDSVAFTEIMAVTSPRVSVTRNVKYAIMLSQEPFDRPSGMMGGVFDSYMKWLDTGLITGQKTRPFANALMGIHTSIPLDVWMCKALQIPHWSLRRKSVFTRATQRVAHVANYLGWWNMEAQAAIWATAVREGGRQVMVVSAEKLALQHINRPTALFQRTLEYTQ